MLDVAVALMNPRRAEVESAELQRQRSRDVSERRRRTLNNLLQADKFVTKAISRYAFWLTGALSGLSVPCVGFSRTSALLAHTLIARNDDAPAVHLCCRARFADSGGVFRAIGTSDP